MSIYAKLLEAQKAITAIAKTGHNDHFNYDFFEEREVLRVAREALNDAGLVFVYSVDDVSDREVTTSKGKEELLTDVRMTCTIYDAESGENVNGGAIGRGQDGQDKGVNKAIVAGLKYWLLKTLMIPTDDDTERNENTRPDGNQSMARGRSKKPAQSAEDMIDCPACSGPMYDNRTDPKASINGGKRPELKCKDKECDHAIWLKSWRDDLIKHTADLHTNGVIDAEERDRAEKAAGSLSPQKMQAVQQWVDEKIREGVLGAPA